MSLSRPFCPLARVHHRASPCTKMRYMTCTHVTINVKYILTILIWRDNRRVRNLQRGRVFNYIENKFSGSTSVNRPIDIHSVNHREQLTSDRYSAIFASSRKVIFAIRTRGSETQIEFILRHCGINISADYFCMQQRFPRTLLWQPRPEADRSTCTVHARNRVNAEEREKRALGTGLHCTYVDAVRIRVTCTTEHDLSREFTALGVSRRQT